MGKLFKRKAGGAAAEPGPMLPSWFSQTVHGGPAVRLGPGDLAFGAKGEGVVPPLEKVGLSELLYGGPEVTADLKVNHVEPSVLSGPLADAMRQIEDKFHQGVYDAAAIPLVEDYLKQLRHLAELQARRAELLGNRVSDVKEANVRAFEAVAERREEREAAIDREYEEAQRLPIARREAKRDKKAAKAQARRDAAMHRASWRAEASVAHSERSRGRRQEAEARRAMRLSYKEAQERRENARREIVEERKLAETLRKVELEQTQAELQLKMSEEEMLRSRAAAELRSEQERLRLAEKMAELDAEAALRLERMANAKKELNEIEEEALRIARERAEEQAAAKEELKVAENAVEQQAKKTVRRTWREIIQGFAGSKAKEAGASEEGPSETAADDGEAAEVPARDGRAGDAEEGATEVVDCAAEEVEDDDSAVSPEEREHEDS